LRILVSLNSGMMVTSRVLSVHPFRLGLRSAVVRFPYGNEPSNLPSPMYPALPMYQ
jgi:hypothetical protein